MTKNRWFIAAIGGVVMLMAGVVYAWSVISSPIGAYFTEWSKAQLSLNFTIVMMTFCLGCFTYGFLSKKLSPMIITLASAVLFLAGFFIASRTSTLVLFYLGYGVMCGFASGLVYNAVMSSVLGWFPDKAGMISGALLMCFGFSSFIIGKVYQAFTSSGAGVEDWRSSLVVMGIILAIVLGLCAFFLKKPAAEDVAKYKKAASGSSDKAAGPELNTVQMLKTPAFWMFLFWVLVISAAGMAVMSQASAMALEAGPETDASTIATVVGLISIANGIGRLFWGSLYDRIGRRLVMTLVSIALAASVALIALAISRVSFTLVTISFICFGFSYGGGTPMNSAVTREYFGAKNYPTNFSVVNLNLLISSFGSTLAGALYDASGSYMSTLIVVMAASAAALAVQLFIKKPAR